MDGLLVTFVVLCVADDALVHQLSCHRIQLLARIKLLRLSLRLGRGSSSNTARSVVYLAHRSVIVECVVRARFDPARATASQETQRKGNVERCGDEFISLRVLL